MKKPGTSLTSLESYCAPGMPCSRASPQSMCSWDPEHDSEEEFDPEEDIERSEALNVQDVGTVEEFDPEEDIYEHSATTKLESEGVQVQSLLCHVRSPDCTA